jgi:hypothetical protein
MEIEQNSEVLYTANDCVHVFHDYSLMTLTGRMFY